MLLRLWRDRIGPTAVSYNKVRGNRELAGRRLHDVANITETVDIFVVRRQRRVGVQMVRGYEIFPAVWMHAQGDDHRCRLRAVVGNLVTSPNFHLCSPREMQPGL